MTQHSDSQYDDDLTVGMDDYDSFSTDSVNLFEFTGDDDSPIARLKTIILSIDWEINDEILQQLQNELLDLNEIWSGDKIKQVYIQGLDKIGKYIFKEKANAHPNAIKLLLTFYYNLEKIVSSEEMMSEEEKKKILLEDVKKFDQLKVQISKSGVSPSPPETVVSQPVTTGVESEQEDENVLKILKAQVLGIDWEINDQELQKLSEEVGRLEGLFSQSKPKLILLQGIGALSSYINKMRSQSSANAFTLLHSFYGALEKMSLSNLSGDEEKTILLAEVAKFNDFKKEISGAKPGSPAVESDTGPAIDRGEPTPVTEEVVQDAQLPEDIEASELDEEESKVVADVESRLSSVFGEMEENQLPGSTDESALAGVNVETEADDDSDEEALPYEGDTVAPALVGVEEESSFSVDSLAKELADAADEELEQPGDSELVVPLGVDVETEADDVSDEEALPMEEGELAPALFGSEEETGFDESLMDEGFEDTESADLEKRLDSFFGDETEPSSDKLEVEEEAELSVDEEVTAGLSFLDEEVAAPAEGESEEYPASEAEEEVSAGLSFLDEEVAAPAEGESEEYPASEAEEEVSAGLSFLDEEVAAPAEGESEEYPASEAEEEVSAGLSFLDEEVAAPAEGESEEYPASEAEEEVSAGLSFLDEEVAAPAEGESEEYPASEVEEEVSAGLSFLDEEVAAPAEGESEEYPASEAEEEVSAGLSFLDEEVAAPAEGESEEYPASEAEEEVSAGLSFLDEEVAAPAEGESEEYPASEAEEEVSAGLSFLDEEVAAPAEGESEEYPASEAEEEVSAGLSFLDEEVAAPAEGESEEYPASEVEEEVSAGLSFLDEEVAAPAVAETEEPVTEGAEMAASVDEEVPAAMAGAIEGQLEEEKEIQFTLPGEEVPDAALDAAVEAESEDDVIEFMVPGDEFATVEAAHPSEMPQSEEVVFEVVADDVEVDPLPGEDVATSASADLVEEQEGDESVEGGGDDSLTAISEEDEQLFEEYSPALPGASQDVGYEVSPVTEEEGLEEDFVAAAETDVSVETAESTQEDFLQEEKEVGEYAPDLPESQFVELSDKEAPAAALEVKEEKSVFGAPDELPIPGSDLAFEKRDLTALRSGVDSLQGDVTDESLQALLDEINSLRKAQYFDYTDKLFLQLLSTICQSISTNRMDESCSGSLSLLQKVFSGLEMSQYPESTADQRQQQVLECVSQVLLLQQKELNYLKSEDRGIDFSDRSVATGEIEEVSSAGPLDSEETLVAFFQEEMAQMRQTFLDEISSLRRELADRR